VKHVNVYHVNAATKTLSSVQRSKKSNVPNVKFKKLSVSSKVPNAVARLKWFALIDFVQPSRLLLVDLARWLSRLLTNVDASLLSVNHDQLQNVQLVLNFSVPVPIKKLGVQFLNAKLTTNAQPVLMLSNKKLKVNVQLRFVVHRLPLLLPPPAPEHLQLPNKLPPQEALPPMFLLQAQPRDLHVLASVLLIMLSLLLTLFSTPVKLSPPHAPLSNVLLPTKKNALVSLNLPKLQRSLHRLAKKDNT
jgi:hypothetical protein